MCMCVALCFKNEHFNYESIREKYNSKMVFDSVVLAREFDNSLVLIN